MRCAGVPYLYIDYESRDDCARPSFSYNPKCVGTGSSDYICNKIVHVSGLPAKGHRRRVAVMTSSQSFYSSAIMLITSIVISCTFFLPLIMTSSDFTQTSWLM